MEDANGRFLHIGDIVTIIRQRKSGKSKPEQATVINMDGVALVRINSNPDKGKIARIGSQNIWLTPTGK